MWRLVGVLLGVVVGVVVGALLLVEYNVDMCIFGDLDFGCIVEYFVLYIVFCMAGI
jgi:hypothetical protein